MRIDIFQRFFVVPRRTFLPARTRVHLVSSHPKPVAFSKNRTRSGLPACCACPTPLVSLPVLKIRYPPVHRHVAGTCEVITSIILRFLRLTSLSTPMRFENVIIILSNFIGTFFPTILNHFHLVLQMLEHTFLLVEEKLMMTNYIRSSCY